MLNTTEMTTDIVLDKAVPTDDAILFFPTIDELGLLLVQVVSDGYIFDVLERISQTIKVRNANIFGVNNGTY